MTIELEKEIQHLVDSDKIKQKEEELKKVQEDLENEKIKEETDLELQIYTLHLKISN